MAHLSFVEAVEAFRKVETNESAALVLRDRALQSVIACWPNVSRRLPEGRSDFSGLALDELWSLTDFDERDVVDLSGIGCGLALAAFRRAKGNRLIYPDGSVHKVAKVILQKMIKDACS